MHKYYPVSGIAQVIKCLDSILLEIKRVQTNISSSSYSRYQIFSSIVTLTILRVDTITFSSFWDVQILGEANMSMI